MKIPIIRVRDEDGNIIAIPAIKGEKGDKGDPGLGADNMTASDVICADGKTVEEQFAELWQDEASMAESLEQTNEAVEATEAARKALAQTVSTNAQTMSAHTGNKQNPHGVTRVQIGAAAENHTHTASAVGAAPTNHTHTAAAVGAVERISEFSTDANVELTAATGEMIVKRWNSTTLNTPYTEGVTSYARGLIITFANSADYGIQLGLPAGQACVYVRQNSKNVIGKWGRLPVIHQSTREPTADDGNNGDVWHQYV